MNPNQSPPPISPDERRWARRAMGTRLGREIVVVLAVKIVLIYGLWYAFIRPNVQDPAPEEVGRVLFGQNLVPSDILKEPLHG